MYIPYTQYSSIFGINIRHWLGDDFFTLCWHLRSHNLTFLLWVYFKLSFVQILHNIIQLSHLMFNKDISNLSWISLLRYLKRHAIQYNRAIAQIVTYRVNIPLRHACHIVVCTTWFRLTILELLNQRSVPTSVAQRSKLPGFSRKQILRSTSLITSTFSFKNWQNT